jgi:hypothetical protein
MRINLLRNLHKQNRWALHPRPVSLWILGRTSTIARILRRSLACGAEDALSCAALGAQELNPLTDSSLRRSGDQRKFGCRPSTCPFCSRYFLAGQEICVLFGVSLPLSSVSAHPFPHPLARPAAITTFTEDCRQRRGRPFTPRGNAVVEPAVGRIKQLCTCHWLHRSS